MRSVYLSNEHLSKLLTTEISFEEFEMFKQNLWLYQEMWKDQGMEFWMKFVISCKEILGTHTGYHNSPHNVDIIYIKFLEVLLEENFVGVPKFIVATILSRTEYDCVLPLKSKNGIKELEKVKCPSDIMCRLVRMSFQLRVAGAFVRMLKIWQNSQPGKDIKWKFPNYWLIPGNENENLELFIKSKWPVKEIVKMFGCEKKTIVWLTATGESSSLNTEQVSSKALLSSLTDQERKELVNYPQTYLGWFPKPKPKQPQRVARDNLEIGNVEVLEQVLEPYQESGRLWHLIQLSLPPLLSRKYHIINVAELMKDGAERNYMGVATWFVMWSQSLGLPLLNSIVNKHKELDKLNENIEVRSNQWKGTIFETLIRNWHDEVDSLNAQIRKARRVKSAPKPEDDATNALTFLLEPCIIIQLPWNTVLLHQWLAAALVEVLLFEKNSMEFHHWPFSGAIEECATSLITLVKRLKERVMLGFAIMFKQANSYPQVEVKHPGWILDEVVLPSLSVLQFLITGKAYTVLKNLKKLAWSKPESTVCMASTTYQMDNSMTEIFSQFCYSSFCFEHIKMFPPFPVQSCGEGNCENDDLSVVIPRLKLKEINRLQQCNHVKSFSQEEMYLAGGFKYYSRVMSHYRSKQYIKIVLTIIKTHVVDPGRLPGLTMDMVTQKFDTPEMRKSGAEMWKKNIFVKPEELVILFAMLCDECYIKLIGSEKKVNIMSKLINLGIEVLERKQIIRLTQMLGHVFKINPIAIKLDQQPPLSIESLSTLVKDCEQKCTSQNRDWLWRQFPAEWKKPVNVFMSQEVEDILTSAEPEAKDLVKSLEERIGCIVFSLAQTCFSVFERGGEVFQDWQTVQYILPCFVAAYVETINESVTSKLGIKSLKMYKLVDTLIRYYEEKYLAWAIHLLPRTTPDLSKMVITPENSTYCHELTTLILYFKEITETLLNVHVNNGRFAGMKGFNKIENALLWWPLSIEHAEPRVGQAQVFFAYRTWLEVSFHFLKELYACCLNAWKIPLPGCDIPDEKLGDMYLADEVMHILGTVFGMCNIYIPCHQSDLPFIKEIQNKIEDTPIVKQWRHDLLSAVITNCKTPPKKSTLFIESERKNKEELYKLIKKFREFSGAINLQCVDKFPDNPPVLKLAVKYFHEADFDKLDKILSIIVPVKKKSSSKSKRVEAPKVVVRNKCSNCPKKERKWETFLVCEKCVEQKYPQVNFFCSQECREERWVKEHQAEHLEFELGLAKF